MDICNYNNPQRAPEWRWLRARGITEGTQFLPSPRRDGPQAPKWIRAAIRFQQELAAAGTDQEKYLLSERRPDLYWAWNLWRNESPMRSTVEALILAREPDMAIGFRCGMDPKIITAYEAVFYNVRDRLEHTEIVVKTLCRRGCETGLWERDYDTLWKLYAYFYGPEMLQAISHRFVNPMWVASEDTVATAIEADAINTLKLKAMLAAKTIPVTSQTQMDLIYAFTKFVEVERQSDSTHKKESQLMDHVVAMMHSLPFDVGGRDPRQGHQIVDRGLTAKFRQSAIELTYQENLQGATGQELPLAEEQLTLHFPPRISSSPVAGGST